ncbi:hypothetical protein [Mycobacterium riyadhense]|uniref:hypothetical protein n=1 Tax=Mycobacterium riyadhense TaxID=486698 RepID=UPI00111C0663|nr:hypothetical protein [Mycobacterium riyadhense]MCV7148225.1 hypothetical protein [Mycobacterium riyadhense]
MTYKALQTSLDFATPYRPGADDPEIGGPAGLGGQVQPIEVVVSLPLSCLPLVERRDEFAATPCPTDQHLLEAPAGGVKVAIALQDPAEVKRCHRQATARVYQCRVGKRLM